MAEVMTDKQLRQARAHIAALCANWDKGRCLILDSPCPQSASYTLLCNYFNPPIKFVIAKMSFLRLVLCF